ncbi:MAG TPA: tRNA pseudouridine(55) synthase TruB [Myxococcota bacterium]|nr:tRNA pseudouridine(55) synthase TruB [Myxococcota bacterium]
MIDGFLVIDKPAGLTSHDVVQRVRRIAKQRRVGHLGTLDPLATGVLPIALGEATKLSQLLTHGAKSYRGRLVLGVETTTYDREGEVVAERPGPWPTRAVLEKSLAEFQGEIDQVPPPYSAVKQGGEAAYVRARRGEEVVLEPRRVTVSRIELTLYEPPVVALEVDCSAGTYLRSMAHDLGAALGTGAHLSELCRTRSGPFTLEQAVTLEALEQSAGALESRVIPMLAATGLPTFEIDARVARRVRNGVQLGRQEIRGVPPEGMLQLAHAGKLVALVEARRGLPELATVRVFVGGTEV